MPGQDGTGPMGQGPLTGRGFGPCGRGFRRGFRRFFHSEPFCGEQIELTKEQKLKILEAQKKEIEAELKEIDREIKDAKTKN
jgi:hypothetical protein